MSVVCSWKAEVVEGCMVVLGRMSELADTNGAGVAETVDAVETMEAAEMAELIETMKGVWNDGGG